MPSLGLLAQYYVDSKGAGLLERKWSSILFLMCNDVQLVVEVRYPLVLIAPHCGHVQSRCRLSFFLRGFTFFLAF